MITLRSFIFNFLFYLNLIAFLILGLPVLLLPQRFAIKAFQLWGKTSNWLLAKICKIEIEYRGLENIPAGSILVAGKHQSFWETFAVPIAFTNPCMVLKQELFYIPLFGFPYSFKFRMIGVARSRGAKALRSLIEQGTQEAGKGRQIIIMPEGKRQAIGAPPNYKPGAAALYAALNVPCVPFGLNAGQHWPKRKFLRLPGKIIVEFGKAIPAGLPRKEFENQMQSSIESITNKLCALNF